MTLRPAFATVALTALFGCGGPPVETPHATTPATSTRQTMVVHDTTIATLLRMTGSASALREATLSTSLMGSVVSVPVSVGEQVATGTLLVSLDAKDLDARATQAAGAVAQAEAGAQQARNHLTRIRALFADSAATRVQLEDAEASVLRTEAALMAARGGVASIAAMRPYAEIRAPFNGMVVRRLVDPGSFVAPGTPVLTLQDLSQLRLTVTIAPLDAQGIQRGARLNGTIEDQPVTGIVEGIVPAQTAGLITLTILVANPGHRFLAGSAASIQLVRAPHQGILLPVQALVRRGDLTGVWLRRADGSTELRWLQIGTPAQGHVEVLSGLRAGETIEIPAVGEQ